MRVEVSQLLLELGSIYESFIIFIFILILLLLSLLVLILPIFRYVVQRGAYTSGLLEEKKGQGGPV